MEKLKKELPENKERLKL